MATLEKIRSKSVLLFVIIIVALLAFILGDFLTSGRTYFGHGNNVAKAAGQTIDYTHYQERMQQASEMAQQQNRQIDADELQQQVVQSLMFEKLLEKEYADLGIVVTDEEITAAMTGDVPHRSAQQFIYGLSGQLGLPAPSGALVYDAMMNPAKYNLPAEAGPQIQQMWAATEHDVEAALLQEKFYRLVNGLFTASEIDAKAMHNDNAVTRHIAYAAKPYSSVPSNDIEITDADVQAQWEKDKAQYRLDEQVREIDYIYVPIEPSQADRVAGQQAVENAIAGLREQPGTDAVSSDIKFVVNRTNAPRSRVTDYRLRGFIDTANVNDVVLLSTINNKYTIAKLIGKTEGIDSINVSFMARADQGQVDSLLNMLNTGTAWSEMIDGNAVIGSDSVWTALEGTGLNEKLKNALANATVGQTFVYADSIQGNEVSSIYRVNRRNRPVTYYEVAMVEYTIDPSYETINDLVNNLTTYVAANSSADEFAANAPEAGYVIQTAQVAGTSPRVGQAHDSRQMVKWAMDAKKGKVSPVYQDNKQSYIMAIAVRDIYDDYLGWNSQAINPQLRDRALRAKKGEMLAGQFAGKANDVAGYAQAMGVEASEGDVNFSSPMLLTIGIGESALHGAIAAAQENKLVGPLEGNNALLVFTVTGSNDQSRPYNFEEYAGRFNQTFGIARINPLQMLLGKDKIENYLLDFIQTPFE